MIKQQKHLAADLFIIAASVVLAIILVKSGIIYNFIAGMQSLKYLGAFTAGIFFTSAFTTAPATAAFIELSNFNSVYLMALLGGLGALLGDSIIFRFVKQRFASDVDYLLAMSGRQRFAFIFRRRLFRWITATIGALIIASPLPDEIGIALLGISKIKIGRFAAVSFLLNGLGILIIGLIAKAV